MDIDVSGPRTKAIEIPLATRLTTVRKFANESPADRIVLCNTRYVVYTLTDKSRLRGIDMEVVNMAVDFDKHTAPVEAAKFMSHRSNIVGSLSANEFMVWLLEANGTQAYFTIPAARAPIRNFAWIAAATPNRPYDLCVQWGKSLATVSASDVIMANLVPAAGAAAVVEKLADRHLQVQDQALEVAAEAPRLMVDLPPYVVMAAAKNEVLACGAKKERIRFVVSSGDLVSLSALAAFPQVVAAASTSAVEVFRLGAGKAVGLLKLSFPASMKVLSATCVNDQIVALYQNSNAADLHARPNFSTVEAAIVRVQPTEQGLTVAHMGFKAIHARATGVAASQFCVSQGAVEDTIALRDTSDALDIIELTERRAPPPAPLSMAAAAFVPRAMPPMAPMPIAPFGLVQSPVMPLAPGVRGGVDAVAQQAATVTEAIKKLQGKVNEVAQVLPMDQEKNLREHMRTALQDALRRTPLAAATGAGAGATAGTISADDSARISQQVVDAMTEPIATMLLGTVMNTVESLAQQKLEEQVQELLEGHIAQMRRAQVLEGQQRAQAVVEEVLSQALSTLALRNKDDVQVLMASLRNIVQPYEDTIAKFQLLVKKQQQRIASLSNPATLEELSRLRAEVAQLRAAAPLGGDAQINAALQRETMLTRARDLVAAGQFNEAATMVAQQRAPDFTLTWLRSLNPAALLSALEAETAQSHPWAAAATQLMSMRDVAGARRDVEDAFAFVYEIVTKGPSTMAEDVPAFKAAAHEYMDWWTAQQPISSVRSKLKEIFVAVR